MTTFEKFNGRNRDMQDGIERHVFGEQKYVDGAGSTVTVQGTGTEDEEATVLNIGGGSFNLPKGSNTEVMLLSGGSDTNLKFAILTIPRDKQRQWAEGTGGVQHPTDPNRAIEFNGDEIWLKDGNFKMGNNKEMEISIAGGVVTMKTASLTVQGDLTVNGDVIASGGVFTHNGVDVGDQHKHQNVTPGAGTSGPPV